MTSDNSYHMNYICMDMKNIFSLVARLIYLTNLYLNGIPSTIFVRENLGWAKSLGLIQSGQLIITSEKELKRNRSSFLWNVSLNG